MADKSVSKPVPAKNIPVEPVSSDVLPKQAVPVWVIFLVLFLISLVVGMGIYIGFQKGWFATRPTLSTKTETPTPSISASAQARIVAGADWKTYTDERAGFTFKYPPTITLNEYEKGVSTLVLGIDVEKIEALPESMPLGLDRKTAIADRESLLSGKAQTIGDFAASDALVRIGGTYNARMTSVLSRFEICSVIFSRALIFYPNDFQVRISLNGDEVQIEKDMPEFFNVDPNNCGDMTMWNRDIRGTFMPTLSEGKGKGAGQLWYDTFDAIIKTITLIPVNVNALPTVTSTVTPIPTPSCEVSDSAFCNVLTDIKNSMAAKNYSGVIAYQSTTSVTCDPDGMAISMCDGKAKGVVVEGYGVGYNESEGNILTRDVHLASLASYVANNGPLFYKGSLQEGDKGVIVYLNGNASNLFVLSMKRAGATWRFQSVLIGGTFGNTAYTTLSPTLLDTIY